MNEYRVKWEIDIYANSPREAALAALEIQRRVGSSAVVFDVANNGETVRVDLDEKEG